MAEDDPDDSQPAAEDDPDDSQPAAEDESAGTGTATIDGSDNSWYASAPSKLQAYGPIFENAGQQYGIDPKVLMAIAMQENVAQGDNNPLGISGTYAPYHYQTPEEAEAAIYHQASVMASPDGPYARARTLDELAHVYSPPGGEAAGVHNDPNNSNSGEASGIYANLQKLGYTGSGDWRTISSDGTDARGSFAPGSQEAIDAEYDTDWKSLVEGDKPPELTPDQVQAEQEFSERWSEKPVTPDMSPLDKFRAKNPEFNDTVSDDALIPEMQKRMAPKMELSTFQTLVKTKNGEKAIKDFNEQGMTPWEKILDQIPALKKVPEDSAMQSVYDKLQKTGKVPSYVSIEDFKDQMKPQSGIVNGAYQLWKGFSRSFSQGAHEEASADYDLPQTASAWAKDIEKRLGVNKILQKADNWLADQERKTGQDGVEDYWRGFVEMTSGAAKQQAQQAQVDQQRAAQATGVTGQVGRTTGELAGSMTEGAFKYLTPLRSGLVIAAVTENMSHYSAAIQAHHDDALIEGFQGGLMGPLQRYFMEGPAGRKAMGGLMLLSDAGEDTIQKWLKGEKIDATDTITRGIIDVLTGWHLGGKEEAPYKAPTANAPEPHEVTAASILGEDNISGDAKWYAQDPIQTRTTSLTGRKTLSPAELKAGVEKIKPGSPEELKAQAEKIKPPGGEVVASGFDPDPVAEELGKAEEAKNNGDLKKASEHTDRAGAAMAPKQRTKLAKDVIKFTKDAAKTTEAKTKADPPKAPVKKTTVDKVQTRMVQNYYGLKDKKRQRGSIINPFGDDPGKAAAERIKRKQEDDLRHAMEEGEGMLGAGDAKENLNATLQSMKFPKVPSLGDPFKDAWKDYDASMAKEEAERKRRSAMSKDDRLAEDIQKYNIKDPGSLQWLADYKAKQEDDLRHAMEEGDAPETIKSVAIRFNGKIYEGVTHSLAMEKAANEEPFTFKNPRDIPGWKETPWDLVSGYSESGFLTNTERFVDRTEAAKIKGISNRVASHVDIEGYSRAKADELVSKPPKQLPGNRGEAGFTLDWTGEIYDWFKEHGPKFEKTKELADKFKADYMPQSRGKEAEAAWVFAKEHTSRAQRAEGAMMKDAARDLDIESTIRGGEKASRRTNLFNSLNDGQLMDVLSQAEDKTTGGKVSSGNPHVDWLMNEFYPVINEAIKNIEQGIGRFQYKAREFYMFHMVELADQEKFEKFYDKYMTGDPRWTKSREYPTFRDLFAAGIRVKTLNPERIMQARVRSHFDAMSKVNTLDDLAAIGTAIPKEGLTKEENEELKNDANFTDIRSPNGEMYYLPKKAAQVLAIHWEPSTLYNGVILGPIAKTFAVAKAIGARALLSWSIVHPLHTALIYAGQALVPFERVALSKDRFKPGAYQAQLSKLMQGMTTGVRILDAWRGERPMTLGEHVKDLPNWGSRWLAEKTGGRTGEIGKRNEGRPLDADEQDQLDDIHSAGLDLSVNEEQMRQMSERMRDWFPRMRNPAAEAAGNMVQGGYQILTSEPLMRFMFGHVIPLEKLNGFLSAREALFLRRPELLKEGNEMMKKTELAKLGDQIDQRFGEMNYKNLFWKKMTKDVGQVAFLSMGWQLNIFNFFGGTVHDMMSNVAHVGELKNKFQGKASEHTFLTDRLLFVINYSAMSMAANAIRQYAYTGQNPDQFEDYFMPRIGKDPKGGWIRARPVEFWTEPWILGHHIAKEGGGLIGTAKGFFDMVANKTNPVFSMLSHLKENKNYFGQQIYDPLDPDQKQLQDSLNHALTSEMTPIPFAALTQHTGRPFTWDSALKSMMGLPEAAGWSGKSATQNLIADTFFRMHPSATKTEGDTEKADLSNQLRGAIQSRDKKAEIAAEEKLRKSGMTERGIGALKKTAGEPVEHFYFQRLSHNNEHGQPKTSQQARILMRMSPEERKEYLPLANKAVQAEFNAH